MNEPKRAEPNEHARMLKSAAVTLELESFDVYAEVCLHAAAELERLAALERPWLPIESAPRERTRVELWFPALPGGHRDHAAYGSWIERGGYWISDSGVRINEPTHWRPEPSGPESKPDQETERAMTTDWIKCVDRMPPDSQPVLIAWSDGRDGYDVARWLGGCWQDCHGLDFEHGLYDYEITKWARFDYVASPPLPTKEPT